MYGPEGVGKQPNPNASKKANTWTRNFYVEINDDAGSGSELDDDPDAESVVQGGNGLDETVAEEGGVPEAAPAPKRIRRQRERLDL